MNLKNLAQDLVTGAVITWHGVLIMATLLVFTGKIEPDIAQVVVSLAWVYTGNVWIARIMRKTE